MIAGVNLWYLLVEAGLSWELSSIRFPRLYSNCVVPAVVTKKERKRLDFFFVD